MKTVQISNFNIDCLSIKELYNYYIYILVTDFKQLNDRTVAELIKSVPTSIIIEIGPTDRQGEGIFERYE